jgi:hypothetical protein
MDKTILNLLFNYKGTVTYQEFRAGIIILFMLVGCYLSSLLNAALVNVASSQFGYAWLASFSMYAQVTASYIPNLVPVWFIVSYASFVLALKRMRALDMDRPVAIFSGITNYLFFASFVALIILLLMQYGFKTAQKDYMAMITPVLPFVIEGLVVIGLVNLIFLCIRRDTEQNKLPQTKGRLDILGYIMKLGKLMAVTTTLSIIFVIIIVIMNLITGNIEVIYLTSGVLCIITLIFYIKYAIYRLWDAGISIFWLVGIMGGYIALAILRVWMAGTQHHLFYIYNTLFAIATSFFIAAQFVMLLLPTKSNDDNMNNKQ